MNNYNPFVCNFETEEVKAKKMTPEQLRFAITDCLECIKLGINPNKYYDQLSVYRKHLAKKVRQACPISSKPAKIGHLYPII